MATPSEIVTDFCGAFADLDVEKILDYFAPDATYHNIPIDPVVGHDAIRATLTMFTGMASGIEFRILHLVADGQVVLTERLDVFTMADGKVVELPVMGTFELDPAGRITAWRDYFDLNQFMTASQG